MEQLTSARKTSDNPVKSQSKTEEEFKIIKIKRYKLCELAAIYEADRKTFRGWLNKFKDQLGVREGHYYSISQVRIIFAKLELPSYVKVYVD